MYAYLFGTVVERKSDRIYLDVNDIGYELFCSMPLNFPLKAKMKVFVSMVIREDDQYLIGFTSEEEKQFFQQLISVKGIGPKTALGALSETTIDAIKQAIAKQDLHFLKKLPGIGPKAASQIVLDLKGKLAMDESKISSTQTPAEMDAKLALRSLGFKVKDIETVFQSLPQGLDATQLIKECLKRLK